MPSMPFDGGTDSGGVAGDMVQPKKKQKREVTATVGDKAPAAPRQGVFAHQSLYRTVHQSLFRTPSSYTTECNRAQQQWCIGYAEVMDAAH